MGRQYVNVTEQAWHTLVPTGTVQSSFRTKTGLVCTQIASQPYQEGHVMQQLIATM